MCLFIVGLGRLGPVHGRVGSVCVGSWSGWVSLGQFESVHGRVGSVGSVHGRIRSVHGQFGSV